MEYIFLWYSRQGKKISYLKGDAWQEAIKYIQTLIPSILYFPNFLFDLPDKIYLETVQNDSKKFEFYNLVIQDILDSLNNKLDVKTHILDRAKSDDKNDKKH